MTAANKKFQQLKRKVHAIEAWKHSQDEEKILPANVTTAEVTCPSCGFKARYKFLRCPECNALREQDTKKETNKEETKLDSTTAPQPE